MPTRWRRRTRAAVRPRFDHGEPIAWLGLVPLAGVLAIAAALILTAYGIQPHVLTVAFPKPSAMNGPGPLTPDADRLVIRENGALLWNGTPVTDRDLGSILKQHAERRPRPALLFTPETKASYARVIEVLRIVREVGLVDRCFRFSDIARFRRFDQPETFDDLPIAQGEYCPPLTP